MLAFSRKFEFLRNFDWLPPIVVFVLSSIGLAAIYSVDLSRSDQLTFFPTQFVALILGIIVMTVASFLHVSFYRIYARFFYIGAVLLLIGVLFFGVTVRGTTGWFRFSTFFSFQPAEFAKIGLILILAWLISRFGRRFDKWQFIVSTGLATFIPVGFIMLQPDFGSALILVAIWLGMLFLTKTKKRYVAAILAMGVGAFLIGWFFLFAPYQKDRILTFMDPARDPLGSGYNVTQSVIAIGAGNLFGRGLGFGSQSQLHFLPETQTDFIFAVIAEELGFVAVCVVLSLYLLLFWRLLSLAKKAPDDFSAYCLVGAVLLFFSQMVLNIGAAAGVLPVTGITLPFLSYGGSSLIINFFVIGLVQSVARSTREKTSFMVS
ncbi:MAG: rod shape-determining protein RodA [Candidatus Magasanikbacteria bacterium]